MEVGKIVFAIQNKHGLYATYGRSEFHKDLRVARLYKSKKTALRNYFNKNGDYKDLKLIGLEIKEISREELSPEEFRRTQKGEVK